MLIETRRETLEEQIAVALAEELALEPSRAAGLIDVPLACEMWELRPREITAGDWELDPTDEIAALPSPVRAELIGGSAAWPDDYVVLKGWLEGAAIAQEALEEADDGDGVKAGFVARPGCRIAYWSRRSCKWFELNLVTRRRRLPAGQPLARATAAHAARVYQLFITTDNNSHAQAVCRVCR